MQSAPQKVAIVTGASAGIGKETASLLLAQGYIVHAAARRVESMRDLERAGARVHFLDLTDGGSIVAFMATVLAESGRLDLLVNNAGYGAYGAVEEVSMSDGRAQMEVNFFGLVQLSRLAIPAMRRQRSGRIVNVTSVGGKIWSPFGAWYHASKFAVEGFSDTLRNEVRPFGIDVIIVEPAGTKTEWGSVAMENARKNSASGPYTAMFEAIAPAFAKNPGATTARHIAQVIWKAASVRKPTARYVAPFSGRAILAVRWVLSDGAFDWLFGKLLRLPATA